MNNLPSHLTTSDESGVLASGYQSWRYSDDQKVYYTVEHVENMRRYHDGARRARSGDLGAAALTDYLNRKRKGGPRVTRTCIICKEDFTVTQLNRKYKTCGSEACTEEARRRTARMGRAAQLAAGVKLRRCAVCDDPLPENAHGNVKMHTWCRGEMEEANRKRREAA